MDILDKVIECERNKNPLEYKKGYDDGFAEGHSQGYEEGFEKAKKQYRAKDFYEPLGEDE